MEKELAFQILNMEQTKEEDTIHKAYHTLLKSTNPEDDPEGFKRLRQAYETAMEYARMSEDDPNEAPKTEVDLWIERVQEFYDALPTRYQLNGWKELLQDPVCEGLDTSLEAREKMLVFLLNHIHLPHDVWNLLDKAFEITEDYQELRQLFPENFLRYVKFYSENETFFPYDLFEYRSLDGENANGDAYIDGLTSIKQKLDSEENADCLQELFDLRAFDIYHPYEDVERLRVYTRRGNEEECVRLIEKLMERIPGDRYGLVYIGEAYWGMGQKEKAHEIWENLLEKSPQFYQAKWDLVRYLMEKEDFYRARELMHELLDTDGENEKIQNMLKEANEALIPEYYGKIERGEEDAHFPGGELVIELGWCLFQNDRMEEAVSLLEKFTPKKEEEYSYYNLFGRLLYQNKEYGRAVPYLENWKKILWSLENDGTKETKKRLSRKNMAACILGACYFEIGRKEDAIASIQDGIDVAVDIGEKLGAMQQLASLYVVMEEYERAVDLCDQIVKEEPEYFPAYMVRQEACYKLHKGQEVIDDYHRAIELYPGFYKPYLFAAEVLFYYNQYQDGLEVLRTAEQNGIVLTPRMLLCQAKILRSTAENTERRKEVLRILNQVEEQKDTPEYDVEDSSEITFERALVAWDDNQLESAVWYIEKAIRENPECLQYHFVCGNIYVDSGKYRKALNQYEIAEPAYQEHPGLYYGRGLCYEGIGSKVIAIENYEKALEFRDVYADACEKISNYYNAKYRTTCKRSYLEKALEYATRQIHAVENCYYLVNRGLIYMNALELEPAIADFEKALTYREDDWPAWNNLGCCYKYLGQFEKAITYYKKAVEYMGQEKDVLPYSNMADCYEALGEYEKAIACYRKNLEFYPGDFDFWEEIGNLYSYIGKYNEAQEAYEHTKNGKDCHKNYYSNLGDLWIRRGDRRKGIGYYKKGIRVANGSDKAERYCDLGELYIDELQEYKKGISCIKRAFEYSSDYSDWFKYERYLAKAYYHLRDGRKAMEHAKAALDYFEKSNQGTREDYVNYKPFAPIRLGVFGEIYLYLGDEEKATAYFQQMEKVLRCRQCRFQQCYEAKLFQADRYLAKKEYAKAIKACRETLDRNSHCNEAVSMLEFLLKQDKNL